MTKKYVYFVSYIYESDARGGNGQAIIELDEKISSNESICILTEKTRDKSKENNVIIQNFILLREEDGE